MIPDIVVMEAPDMDIRTAILDPLAAYNESKTGPLDLAQFAVALKEPGSGKVLGGLWARSVYEWFFVEFLFIPENLRGQGLGTHLMQKAEECAIARGCAGLCVDSFDFQAPGFYRKLGYEFLHALESPRRGFKRHFFRKLLTEK